MAFALKGDPEASWYQAQSAIDDLLLAGRYDAIEALGKKWEYRSDSLSESTSRTAYAELVGIIRDFIPYGGTHGQHVEHLTELIKKHPDNDVLRLALARLYLKIDIDARGSKTAFEVTPKGWKSLAENTAKCWEVLEPMLQKEHVPPEAYSAVATLARYQGWDPDRLQP